MKAFTLSLFMMITSASASEKLIECRMGEDCKRVIDQITPPSPPKNLVLLRDEEGKAVRAGYWKTHSLCKGHKLHMPTPYEFAQYAQSSLGVRGIVDECTSFTVCDIIRSGPEISFTNPEFARKYIFRFSSEGYSPPPQFEGEDFWLAGGARERNCEYISVPGRKRMGRGKCYDQYYYFSGYSGVMYKTDDKYGGLSLGKVVICSTGEQEPEM